LLVFDFVQNQPAKGSSFQGMMKAFC